MRALLAVLVLVGLNKAQASEPAYCTPTEFFKHEVSNQYSKVKRLRTFKLGETTLAGLAVGNSKAADVIQMSEGLGKTTSGDNYCIWYFNEGDGEAERIFSHKYVPNPRTLSEQESYNVYLETLGAEFGTNALSFVSCIEKYNFVGMGCNGQKHRGPTVFGMLLAYSGCTPEHAAEIVNTIWSLNGVPAKNRLAAIRAGYDRGNEEPEARQTLQDKLSAR
jgi:hypothetical protein